MRQRILHGLLRDQAAAGPNDGKYCSFLVGRRDLDLASVCENDLFGDIKTQAQTARFGPSVRAALKWLEQQWDLVGRQGRPMIFDFQQDGFTTESRCQPG